MKVDPPLDVKEKDRFSLSLLELVKVVVGK